MTGNVGGIRPGSPTPEEPRRITPSAPLAPKPALPVAPRPVNDRNAAHGDLEGQAGPLGEQAMATGPVDDDFGGFEGFGAPAPSASGPLDAILADLQGPPAKAAEATARLLANPQQFVDQLKALQPLQGTPGFPAIRANVDKIAALATPANLVKNLGEGPFSKEMITNLARLRAIDDPTLQGALDKVAAKLLPGLKPEDFDEATAVLVGNGGNQAALAAKAEEWTRQAYDATVGSRHGEDGVKQGLEAFQARMTEIARKTGLGPQVEAAAQKVLNEKHGDLENRAKEGRSLWKRLTGGISGLIEGVTGGIGKALKFATDGVGKLAHFAINVTGKIQTVGLDLGAAALDAVGAKGAARTVRGASELVQKTYDAVGNQVQLFAEGVGSAFRDTVTGIGATIAHPIQTMQGIAHLVAHPSELPKVAKALWDTATEKGPAYAIGYVAGNLLPALLTGGSSTEGTLVGRVAAIAGESKVLTSVGRVAGELGEAAQATRLGGLAVRGYSATAKIAGRVTEFTSVPLRAAGKLVGESEAIQRAVAFVGRAGETPVGRFARRLGRAYEDRMVAINDAVDDVLRGGLKRLDGSAAGQRLVRGAESRLPQVAEDAAAKAARAERAAEAARLAKVQRNVPGRQLTEADRDLLARHGKSAEEVEELNRLGLGKNPGAEHKDKLVAAHDAAHDEALLGAGDKQITKNRKLYDDRQGALERIGGNRVEDGVIYEGARPFGEMPNVRVNFSNPRLAEARDVARAIARDATLTAEQKIDQVVALVRGSEGRPPLLRAASSSPETDALFNKINAGRPGQRFRLEELDTYLENQVGDCRHFALTNQSLLQEAVPELNPRVVYTTTFEKAENGTAIAVNHAFNVVTINGEEIAVDAILPHFTHGKVADYVHQGLFGREVRFVQDRFQILEGRWSQGTPPSSRYVFAAGAGQLGQQQQR